MTTAARPATGRFVLAWLTAPPVGIVALAAALGLLLVLQGELEAGELATSVIRASGFLLLFGAPGAYLMELLIGLPSYGWLRRRGGIRPGPVLLIAGLTGALAFTLQWALVWGGGSAAGLALELLFGAVGGMVAGLWFWLVAFQR